MAEELLESKTFAEINAEHSLGDAIGMPPVESSKETPLAGDPPAEPVNWEVKHKELETNFTKKEQDYLAKIKEHEAKVEELSKKPPIPTHKDSDLSRLEIIKLNSPEKFDLYTKLLFSKPNATDLWKMDFLEKNPEYREKPEIVEDLLQDAFSAYFDPDADTESREYKVAAAKLEIAGNQIKAQKLAEFKAIAVPDSQEAETLRQKEKSDLAKSWEIPFAELSKTPLSVSQKIALDDKSEIEVAFTPQDNKKYNDLMGMFILHNDLKPSAENAEKARNYAIDEIIRENLTEIIKGSFQKEFEKRYAAWQKTRNNNHPLAPSNISTDGKKSKDQEILEMMEHGEVHVP